MNMTRNQAEEVIYVRGDTSPIEPDSFKGRIEPRKHQNGGLDTSYENWKTFLAKKSFTEEEDNYLRVCLLLSNTGTEAVGIRFDKYFSQIRRDEMSDSATLKAIFSTNFRIINDMKRNNQINDSEWQLLFPIQGEVDRANFDIKLMAELLTAFDKTSVKLEESTKKAIGDIKYQRNKIVHEVSRKLSNDQLNTIWDTISKAIKQLTEECVEQERLERECFTLRNVTPDSSNAIILQNITDLLEILKDINLENCLETTDDKSKRKDENNSIPPKDKDNFLRVFWLLIKIAPIAVRYICKKLFEEGLSKTPRRLLAVNADIDLERYIGHSVTKDNVDNYSLPELLFILKHRWNFQILDDELPHQSETSIDADLTRINYYTRLIVDPKTDKSLTSTAFNDIWDKVSEAISRLGDVQMKQQCECLKKGEINKDIILGLIEISKEMKKQIDVLKRRIAEQDPLSKVIRDKIEEVEKWVIDDKGFVNTRSSDLLLKYSRDKHVKSITVVGSFGVGKTFITRHVALALKQKGYRILPVSTVAEIIELDDERIRTLFIVDDFCGTSSFKKRMCDIKMWKKMPEDFLNRRSKIVVCCTSMIYQHFSFNCLSYFQSCVIDLNATELSLNNNELRAIAIQITKMNDKLIKKYSCKYSFFPLLCKKISNMKENISNVITDGDISKIVEQVYQSQLSNICREDNDKKNALALIVQFNNIVNENIFVETSKDHVSALDKINKTFNACNSDHVYFLSDLKNLKNELESMIGSFILVSEDSEYKLVYSAKNIHLYNMLVAYFKKEHPEYFLGPFPSHYRYSRLHSFFSNSYKRATTCIITIPEYVYKTTKMLISLLCLLCSILEKIVLFFAMCFFVFIYFFGDMIFMQYNYNN